MSLDFSDLLLFWSPYDLGEGEPGGVARRAARDDAGHLGRYQVGQEVVVHVRTFGAAGTLDDPAAAPVVRFYRDGVFARSVVATRSRDPRPAGCFVAALALGADDAPGRYAAVWGSGEATGTASFDVVAGGDEGGAVLAAAVEEYPDGPAALAHLASGRLEAGRSPSLDDGSGAGGRMPTTLRSGLARRTPAHFSSAADGTVLVSDGLGPMLKWDGTSRPAELAGVPAPATAPTIGPLTGGILATARYFAYVRFVDRRGNPSDLSPISAGVLALDVGDALVVDYSGVAVPSGVGSENVARRQILRNTLGQVDTFYVDVDTEDLVATTFQSTQSDAEVSGGEAVPLEDELGDPLANTHGFPPSHKAVTAPHLGRMFAAVDVAYLEGHAAVESGSTAVRGEGTAWPSSFAGRKLYVPGAPASYEVESVDVDAQTLVLAAAYGGASDPFAPYAIAPHPGERKLVYWTPAGEPESWPATYAFGVQEDGDEVTGLMPMASFLYVLERRHVYRFTFKDDPARDGGVFLSSQRGCLNNRLWVQAEDAAYMLDEMGVHAFSGGESTPVSAPIQDLFRDDTDSPLRVNWGADSALWHASYSEVHATVRFFVAMAGSRFPRHALCYNYRARRWWIEEYTRPVTASCRGRIGTVRALAGVDHRELIALDVGYAEGARDAAGTLRGTATASTPLSLSDSLASFRTDLVNAPLHLVSGRGAGQWRRIVAASPTRLDVDRPWLVAPDATTGYAAAGIAWEWRSGTFRFADVETSVSRDVELVYQPNAAGSMDLQMYYDHADSPRDWAVGRDGSAATTAGASKVAVDLTDRRGRADHRMDGHLERNAAGDRYVAAGLSGVQAGEPVRVYRVTVNGVEAEG